MEANTEFYFICCHQILSTLQIMNSRETFLKRFVLYQVHSSQYLPWTVMKSSAVAALHLVKMFLNDDDDVLARVTSASYYMVFITYNMY